MTLMVRALLQASGAQPQCQVCELQLKSARNPKSIECVGILSNLDTMAPKNEENLTVTSVAGKDCYVDLYDKLRWEALPNELKGKLKGKPKVRTFHGTSISKGGCLHCV